MGKGKDSKREGLLVTRRLKRNAILKKAAKKTFPKVDPATLNTEGASASTEE